MAIPVFSGKSAEQLLQHVGDAIKAGDWSEVPENLHHCFLCRKPTVIIGLWFPHESIAQLIGQPKGKTRSILYSLCDGCSKRAEDDIAFVEEVVVFQHLREKLFS